MKRDFAWLLLCVLLSGCAYSVHNVYVSGFEPYSPKTKGEPVSSHGEQFTILGITMNTDYVDEAYEKLQAACPKGQVVGISTEYQTALGFFSWRNHVYMKGLCVSGQSKAKTAQIDEDHPDDE